MDETELNIREEIIRTGIRMNELDINQGTSGNISVRWKEGILLTPTGIPYEELQPEDICHQSWNGKVEGKLEISSEWRFHLAIQKNRKMLMLSFIPTPTMQPHWPSRKWKSLPSTTWWQPEGGRTSVVRPMLLLELKNYPSML